ncbi:MAG: TniB family NTP-binding protein [Chloroflexota bacterium]|nr:TniB family NTP-binding protein [Chloroflexota bacterium]
MAGKRGQRGTHPLSALILEADPVIVPHRGQQLLLAALKESHEAARAGSPRHLVVEGPVGMGKSTVAARYERTSPAVTMWAGVRAPVVHARIGSVMRVSTIVESITAALGDKADQASVAKPVRVGAEWLVRRLEDAGVQLLMLDEIDMRRSAGHDLENVGAWLSAVASLSHASLVLLTPQDGLDRHFAVNAGFPTRFASRVHLEPFAFDPADTNGINALKKFVGALEDAAGIVVDAGIHELDILYRLHYSSGGVIGRLVSLIRGAQLVALERGSSVVTLADLYAAHEQGTVEPWLPRLNPFGSGSAGARSGAGGRTRQAQLVADLPSRVVLESARREVQKRPQPRDPGQVDNVGTDEQRAAS